MAKDGCAERVPEKDGGHRPDDDRDDPSDISLAVRIIGAQPSEGSRIPGIRKWPQEYLPKIYDASNVDELVYVSQDDAEDMCRRLAREEGLLVGGSSGTAVAAALRVAARGGLRVATGELTAFSRRTVGGGVPHGVIDAVHDARQRIATRLQQAFHAHAIVCGADFLRVSRADSGKCGRRCEPAFEEADIAIVFNTIQRIGIRWQAEAGKCEGWKLALEGDIVHQRRDGHFPTHRRLSVGRP